MYLGPRQRHDHVASVAVAAELSCGNQGQLIQGPQTTSGAQQAPLSFPGKQGLGAQGGCGHTLALWYQGWEGRWGCT